MGEPLRSNRFCKTVKDYEEPPGDPLMPVRSLRLAHISLLHKNGLNVVVVKRRLGHFAVSITADSYAQSLH